MADDPAKDWKKAQAGWDGAKQRAGAVPPLPQRNSNADVPDRLIIAGDADLDGGLRAMQELANKQAELQKAVNEGTKPLGDAVERAAKALPPDYWLNRMDRKEREREDRKQDITAAIGQSEQSAGKVVSGSTERGFWTYIDKAVLSLFEMLALLFGLPFGDDLYNNRPGTSSHFVYLGIGALFAIGGPMFPMTRKIGWFPKWVAPSISIAARDARIWIAILLIFFLYGVAPEVYQRAIAPTAAPVVTGFTQQQVDEKIAAATAALQKQLDQAMAERDAARNRARQLEALEHAPPGPPTPVEGPRIFADKTVEQIWAAYCEKRTELQCSILMNEEKNKWIIFGAKIAIVHAGEWLNFWKMKRDEACSVTSALSGCQLFRRCEAAIT